MQMHGRDELPTPTALETYLEIARGIRPDDEALCLAAARTAVESQAVPSEIEVKKLMVSVEEAAEMLSLGRSTMWKLVWKGPKRGGVLSVSPPGIERVLIPVSALEEYVQKLVERQG